MKDFKDYTPKKYKTAEYQQMGDGIYKTKHRMLEHSQEEIFVTSLSFEMEPERFGEKEGSPGNIAQIPMEGLLDEFNVFVTDFYDELNRGSEQTCYLEFGSFYIDDIKKLRTLIGKKLYAVLYTDEKNKRGYYKMVLE